MTPERNLNQSGDQTDKTRMNHFIYLKTKGHEQVNNKLVILAACKFCSFYDLTS